MLFALNAPGAQGFMDHANPKGPVEIQAEKGITCHQDSDICRAEGNVEVAWGEARLKAQTIQAYLLKIDDSHKTLAKIEPSGNVSLSTTDGTKTLTADKGFYDLQKNIMQFQGNPVCIRVNEGWITAKEIYYDGSTSTIRAMGEAQAFKEGHTLSASVLTAVLRKDIHNKLSIQSIQAEAGFMGQKGADLLMADKGSYDAITHTTQLQGNVKLIRPQGVLTGKSAIGNEKDKSWKINGTPSQRVKMLFNL